MIREQKELGLYDVQSATARQQRYVDSTVRHAKDFTTDPDREARLKSGECVVCYYVDSRIGGAAMTTTNCRACNKEMGFGSTCVDTLCRECAQKLKLCAHCGGDIDLRRRKKVDVESITKVKPFVKPEPLPRQTTVLLLPLKENK